MEPGAAYNLRVTAHNNAGSSIKEYYFETLRLNNMGSPELETDIYTDFKVFQDINVMVLMLAGLLFSFFAVFGLYLCVRNCKY